MDILILGATGFIGASVTAALIRYGHRVTGLSRSDESAAQLQTLGAAVLPGDIRDPSRWIDATLGQDLVIHSAATFSDDMGSVDAVLVEALIDVSRQRSKPLNLIYTGGCWLYGNTGDRVATERDTFNPISAFAWMHQHSNRALTAPSLSTCVIHPAMVYDENGGALSRYLSSLHQQKPISIWGSPTIRWPVVHRNDLARAYRLVAEHGVAGTSYNVSGEQGVRVGDIVGAISSRFGIDSEPSLIAPEQVLAEQGQWAVGPMLDQQMSADKIRRELGWQPDYTDIVELQKSLAQ